MARRVANLETLAEILWMNWLLIGGSAITVALVAFGVSIIRKRPLAGGQSYRKRQQLREIFGRSYYARLQKYDVFFGFAFVFMGTLGLVLMLLAF